MMKPLFRLPKMMAALVLSLFAADAIAQSHCKVRYTYNVTGDRIKRDWYCWIPGEGGDPDPEYEPKNKPVLADIHLEVMPNPASDQLVVTVPEGFTSGKLELITSAGSVVATERVGGTKTIFDVNGFSEGQYFLRFTRDSEMIITPVIIE